METDNDTTEENTLAVKNNSSCLCQGECTCGTKYKTVRPVYYEVDINEYINALNDWD